MKRYLLAGLVASVCFFAGSATNAAPLIAKDLAIGAASSTIEVKGGHGRGHGWRGHRGRHFGWHRGHHGRHFGWHRGHHRGWGHARRHWRW